jgi:hypothetical protein
VCTTLMASTPSRGFWGWAGRPQIYGDCGGVSSSIPIVCASLSRRVSPSRGCGTPWSWPCTNGALSIANHCHMSRLDSLTVVDYMVVRPRLLTLIRVRQGTSHEWNGRACRI